MAGSDGMIVNRAVVEPQKSGSSDNGRMQTFPITFIKNMNLDKGYVPEREIRKATEEWEGTPVSLGHPEDSRGNFIPIENQKNSSFGIIENPEVVEKLGDVYTQADMTVDMEYLNSIGHKGEQTAERLENGNTVSVSSAYLGDKLPSGEYDGEYREQVMGNLEPDHVAVLPNEEGVCSVRDGCMAGEEGTPGPRASGTPGLTANMNCNCDSHNEDEVQYKFDRGKAQNALIMNLDTRFTKREIGELKLMGDKELQREMSRNDICECQARTVVNRDISQNKGMPSLQANARIEQKESEEESEGGYMSLQAGDGIEGDI